MRHPHDLKSASGIIVTRANTPEDVTSPSGNPICTRLPNRPRRPAGACSITIRDAPPHSPPMPMPWMSRKITRRIRGPRLDLLVGRETPDDECSQRHDHHCDHQHDLAADPIAEMTEDGPTDRTCNEPYRIGCERSQRTGQRIDVGKKESVKDECRCGAIDQEIVPFDDGADRTGEDDRCLTAYSLGRDIANCEVNTHVVPPSRDCYPVDHRAPRASKHILGLSGRKSACCWHLCIIRRRNSSRVRCRKHLADGAASNVERDREADRGTAGSGHWRDVCFSPTSVELTQRGER